MPRNSPPLLLEQRLNRRANSGLHCSETSLRLTDDERELVLSRYSEHYGPALVRWIERSHTVSVSELFRWLVANGETTIRRHESPANHAVSTQPFLAHPRSAVSSATRAPRVLNPDVRISALP